MAVVGVIGAEAQARMLVSFSGRYEGGDLRTLSEADRDTLIAAGALAASIEPATILSRTLT